MYFVVLLFFILFFFKRLGHVRLSAEDVVVPLDSGPGKKSWLAYRVWALDPVRRVHAPGWAHCRRPPSLIPCCIATPRPAAWCWVHLAQAICHNSRPLHILSSSTQATHRASQHPLPPPPPPPWFAYWDTFSMSLSWCLAHVNLNVDYLMRFHI